MILTTTYYCAPAWGCAALLQVGSCTEHGMLNGMPGAQTCPRHTTLACAGPLGACKQAAGLVGARHQNGYTPALGGKQVGHVHDHREYKKRLQKARCVATSQAQCRQHSPVRKCSVVTLQRLQPKHAHAQRHIQPLVVRLLQRCGSLRGPGLATADLPAPCPLKEVAAPLRRLPGSPPADKEHTTCSTCQSHTRQ